MSPTPRILARVIFGLAGAGSALFVHFLPAPSSRVPEPRGPNERPRLSVPSPVIERPSATLPYAGSRRVLAEPATPGTAAAAAVAVDGNAGSDAPPPRAR